jgi:hypothetical protein
MEASMKMAVFLWVVEEGAGTSETSVNFYKTTWLCNSEDSHILV